jgi:hypothetical protein
MNRIPDPRLKDWMPDLAPAINRPRRIALFYAVATALILAALSIGA